jgi:hypothetical protein
MAALVEVILISERMPEDEMNRVRGRFHLDARAGVYQ